MSAGELADHFDVSKPTMSAHFAVLLGADLIEAEKDGRSIIYRLRMSVLEEALLDSPRPSPAVVDNPSDPTNAKRKRNDQPSNRTSSSPSRARCSSRPCCW